MRNHDGKKELGLRVSEGSKCITPPFRGPGGGKPHNARYSIFLVLRRFNDHSKIVNHPRPTAQHDGKKEVGLQVAAKDLSIVQADASLRQLLVLRRSNDHSKMVNHSRPTAQHDGKKRADASLRQTFGFTVFL